jgi:hypothetical protein
VALSEAQEARNRVARAARRRQGTPADVEAARRELAEAIEHQENEAHVRAVVANAGKLTAEQIDQLRSLLPAPAAEPDPDCSACQGTGQVHAGKRHAEPCRLCVGSADGSA